MTFLHIAVLDFKIFPAVQFVTVAYDCTTGAVVVIRYGDNNIWITMVCEFFLLVSSLAPRYLISTPDPAYSFMQNVQTKISEEKSNKAIRLRV